MPSRAGGGDDGQAAGERLEKGIGVALEARRQHEEACFAQRLGAVLDEAWQHYPVLAPALGPQALQVSPVRPLPVNREPPAGMLGGERGEALNQDVEPLLVGEPSKRDQPLDIALLAAGNA